MGTEEGTGGNRGTRERERKERKGGEREKMEEEGDSCRQNLSQAARPGFETFESLNDVLDGGRKYFFRLATTNSLKASEKEKRKEEREKLKLSISKLMQRMQVVKIFFCCI